MIWDRKGTLQPLYLEAKILIEFHNPYVNPCILFIRTFVMPVLVSPNIRYNYFTVFTFYVTLKLI